MVLLATAALVTPIMGYLKLSPVTKQQPKTTPPKDRRGSRMSPQNKPS